MTVRRLALEQPESFAFTPANKAWCEGEIGKYPPGRQASAVVPLLWKAQAQSGYWLPRPAIEAVADMLGMPYIRVLEIATFYSMFNLEPVGRYFVQLCGTTPCMLRGSNALKAVCETRIGPERRVTADGMFSWAEVECLGACCNAPMVQINDDYFEDLDTASFGRLLDDLAAGRPVKKGSQTGRVSSEQMPGPVTTLMEASLFDGSVVGAWKAKFEERAHAAEAAKAAAPTPPTVPAVAPSTPAAAPAATAGDPAARAGATSGGAPVTQPSQAPAAPAAQAGAAVPAQAASAPPAPREAAAKSESDAATDQPMLPAMVAAALRPPSGDASPGEAAARLAALPSDATPAQKADAVGKRPAALAAPRGGTADDLKRIKGVGRVNEGKLNALGIFHFDQIAAWLRKEIDWVGHYLSFPGRIDREEWVRQAGVLAKGGETEFSKRVGKGEVPTSAGGPSRPDKMK
jgi:NADH-quinone oxidoreductase subunit E